MFKVGDTIRINYLADEKYNRYDGKVGVITHTDKDFDGCIRYWGTWGGVCVCNDYGDSFELVK